MRWGVVTFPGSLDDGDAAYALEQVLGDSVVRLWHKDRSLHGVDCVVLPGGFSYGDYLRAGALARFSPVMESIVRFARDGGLVIGICNGFQILQEAGLLPGAMLRNRSVKFLSQPVHVRIERSDTPLTAGLRAGDVLTMPIAHGEGNYYLPPDELQRLEDGGQVVFRYARKDGGLDQESNPNGSANAIARSIRVERS